MIRNRKIPDDDYALRVFALSSFVVIEGEYRYMYTTKIGKRQNKV
jgi:hypothetical protein